MDDGARTLDGMAMDRRELGRTGWRISPISYGAWAIGGDAWGRTDDAESMRSLHRAVDLGVNFIDTADVYGNGHSERFKPSEGQQSGRGAPAVPG